MKRLMITLTALLGLFLNASAAKPDTVEQHLQAGAKPTEPNISAHTATSSLTKTIDISTPQSSWCKEMTITLGLETDGAVMIKHVQIKESPTAKVTGTYFNEHGLQIKGNQDQTVQIADKELRTTIISGAKDWHLKEGFMIVNELKPSQASTSGTIIRPGS